MKRNQIALVLLLVAMAAAAEDRVLLELQSSRGAQTIGYYAPQQTDLLASAPATLKRLPASLVSPTYALIPIGPPGGGRVYHVLLDEPAGRPAVIYVDANGNGDLTDDARAEWRGSTSGGFTTWSGGAMLRLGAEGTEMEVRLALYRFDPADPSRSAYARKLFYYRDWLRRGRLELGDRGYDVILSDEPAAGDFRRSPLLLIDLNGDGLFHSSRESTSALEPFNVGGTSWEIRDLGWSGSSLRIVRSTRSAPEMTAPPDHRVGRPITPFTATDMEGHAVSFPQDFRGKVVLLDFWATWCGPCMSEMPNLVSVLGAPQPKGFEILGVSLDSSGQDAAVRSVLRQQKMSWPQIYEGGDWRTRLAVLYAVDSIPAGFLVDGDTGLILAVGGSLRGAALEQSVRKALSTK